MGGMFGKDNMQLGDSGLSVGDVKGMGYTDDEVKSMAKDAPLHDSASGHIAKGIGGGIANGLKSLDKPVQKGNGGAMMQFGPQPTVDADMGQGSYLDELLKKQKEQQMFPLGGNAFYGG